MAMKESGIEWVGLIPDDWKIAKNNRLFNIPLQFWIYQSKPADYTE